MAIHSYLERCASVQASQAFAEELVLFQNEQTRHGKPPLKAAAAQAV